MIAISKCRSSPISQNLRLVNTFSQVCQIAPEGYNAQNKEFVNRTIKDLIEKNPYPDAQTVLFVNRVVKDFTEKNLEPEAQNALAVNRFLKNYQDFFQRG